MSAKDRFHQAVKNSLIKAKWIITHDPLCLDLDNARIQVDLAVPYITYQDFFRRYFAQQTVKEAQISLIVYDPYQEVILEWIN
jgi:hypothetical protein